MRKKDTIYIKVLKNNGNQINNLNSLLSLESQKNYQKVLRCCYNNYQLKKTIDDRLFPKKINFRESIISNNLSFYKMLFWACVLINTHCDVINEFLSLKQKYESSVLLGNYDVSKDLLNIIEKEFGQSLWLVESKHLLSNISSEVAYEYDNKNQYLMVYLEYLKIKNDLHLSNMLYSKIMKNTIDKNIKNSTINEYFKYKLFVNRRDLNWEKILKYSLRFSLIDIYLLVVDLIQETLENNNDSDDLFQLLSPINSEKISLIKSNYYKEEYEVENEELVQLVRDFDSSYKQFSNIVKKDKEKYINSIFAYCLICVHNMLSDTEISFGKCLANDLLKNISILKENQNIDLVRSAVTEIYKYCRIFSLFDIGNGLLVFFSDYINLDALISNSIRLNSYLDADLFSGISLSNGFLLIAEKPRIYISDELISQFFSWFETISVQDVAYNYYRKPYITFRVNEFIKKNEIIQAISLFVESYLENELFVLSIDISEMLSFIEERTKNNELLTLEEVCFLSIDGGNSSFKNILFNVLDSCEHPSQSPLEYIQNNSSKKSIQDYFLHKVCNLNCLKEMYWLEDTLEGFINLRISILKYLLDSYTAIDNKLINDEIKELTKKGIINNRIKKVDSSRIYIDYTKCWENDYEKLEYLLLKYNNSNAEEQSIFFFDFSSKSTTTYVSSKWAYLNEIYFVLINSFCFSDFGLDNSISTRIRHGAFYNQLKNVLEKNEISDYDKGDNYFNKLVEKETIDKKIFDELENLNNSITRILDYAVNNQFKVVLTDQIKGAIFNYGITAEEDNLFLEEYSKENNLQLDAILWIVKHLLINKTNKFLKEIRDDVLQNILNEITQLLDLFSQKAPSYFINKNDSVTRKEINRRIVNCKSELQKEVEIVKQWFYLSRVNDWEDYSFGDLLDTVNGINEKLFSKYDTITINQTYLPHILKGSTFRSFVDIYLILFNNAISHSGFVDSLKSLSININIEVKENICLVFSNNLKTKSKKYYEAIDKKIDDLNGVVYEEKYKNVNTRQEGGMGLNKIMHMLFLTSTYGENMSFYRDSDTFNVKIELRKEMLRNENTAG